MHDRLRRARLLAGFASAKAAITRFGWKASTYCAHENGQNSFKPADAFIYARAFRVSPTWLLIGEYGANAPCADNTEHGSVSGENPAPDATTIPAVRACASEDHFDLTIDAETLTDLAHFGDIVRFSPLADYEVLSDGDIVAIERPTAYGADVCIKRVFFRDGLTLFATNDIVQAEAIPQARIIGAAIWLLRRLAN